ncbi:hypothetical protein VOLCADRAFT_103883 [Volvox carteri f. nagariensis]|uniref:Peptidoglycan binding-like domain-containing protein n=1 Tax=Volvox carteri f. nagariensis TaxID=3068 RepID=D8TPV0_VOLCA|nr:uncharacterized protein VOLCADRAFT_103883 [Volvox carteri f. nagariensis]EFJ50292.1 hypothetical protein VOLCADRAFT_103883 [Volvox carteri f. nagariensis]|eukprot:XP_002948417.1 hypothetical protein VOLCADRAFT_103883 [Volvox carteri f. nagariensis]
MALAKRSEVFIKVTAYIDRERFLLSELAAARNQVDKLLDQQRVLLDMVVRLSGLQVIPSGQTLSQGSSFLQAASRNAASAPSPSPVAPSASTRPTPNSASSSSPDVPAFSSLADLFKSAAAAAPHPASAAAAASIAAAVSAVDTGDILAINNFDIPNLPPPPAPASASAAATSPAPPLPQPSLLFDTKGGFTAVTASATASVSYTSTTTAAEAAEGDPAVAAVDLPVEVAKAAPTDPPPELVQGDDDIYWLSRLHTCLEQRGFFPGDDDMENWFFGEGTLAAVLSFQASERLPETGVVDRPTWTALLGVEVAEELYARAAALSNSGVATATTATAEPASSQPSPASSARISTTTTSTAPAAAAPADLTKWPVLMDGDGGREVHAMQVALANSGFYCGEDDMRWWQFGDATLTALKYFQSCSSIPESGVCDERTWRALLGREASPADLYLVRLNKVNSDDEDGGFDDDMDGISQGRVWLLGEQRWERRP